MSPPEANRIRVITGDKSKRISLRRRDLLRSRLQKVHREDQPVQIYVFALKRTIDTAMPAGGGAAPAGAVSAVTASDPTGGLTFSEAMEKQLGLKVQLQQLNRPVLVIDHIERNPTDN